MHGGADLWTFVFLGLVLKVPVAVVLGALWYVARAEDAERRPVVPPPPALALCAYCGTAVRIGLDASAVHAEAARIAAATGEAAFDVAARLVRGEVAAGSYTRRPPETCPDCGERTVWVPIEPYEQPAGRPAPVRPG